MRKESTKRELAAMTPAAESGDTGPVQDKGDRIPHVEHHVPDRASIFIGAISAPLVRRAARTGDRSERPIKYSNDLASGYFFRGPGQMIASAFAFLAGQNSGNPQFQ